MGPGNEITHLLAAVRRGEREAEENLARLVYGELHKLARRYMRQERADHTLQPTALVNEAFLRLMRPELTELHDRAHFFASAATVMRRILVDHAREKSAAKRAGGQTKVELDDFLASTTPHYEELLTLHDALTRLSEWDGRQARLVEMIYFGGLTEQEASLVLDVSVRTVRRDWRAARAWLQAQLSRSPG